MKRNLLICLILLLSVFLFSSCTNNEKDKYFKNYGKSNATLDESEWLDSDVVINIYLVKDSSKIGYIDCAKRSIEQANSSSKYSITYSDSSDIDFTKDVLMATDISNLTGANAYYSGDCELSFSSGESISHCKFLNVNTTNIDNYSTNGAKHIILHELGHLIGLKDLKDAKGDKNSKFAENSVMYYGYNTSSTYTFTSFTEFDNKNIKWIEENQ